MRWESLSLIAVLVLAGCSVKDNTANRATELRIVPISPVNERGRVDRRAVSDERAVDPAGAGGTRCAPRSIALAGPMTGPDAAWGRSIRAAVKFAIDRHNQSNPNCRVTQKSFDTEGDPQKATQVIPNIVNDESIIGMVGPMFSGENKATGQVLNDAGLVSVNSSATNASLSKNGWRTFFRGLANDDVQGTAMGKYLADTAKFDSVCVMSDNTDYGVGLAKTVRTALGEANDTTCSASVKEGDKDFSAAVSKIKATEPDAVFFAGYYPEAALLARQLKDSGSTATFASGDASNSPQFLIQAGDAAKGAILSCPCEPIPKWFATDYKKHNGHPPGLAAIEGYDLTTILLKGIDAGRTTRAEMLDFVTNYKGQGIARTYQWDNNGELTSARIWIHKVKEVKSDGITNEQEGV